MCGIVGSINHHNIVPDLLQGLSNIEYRGYDSAGISVITPTGLATIKRPGKLEQLRQKLAQIELNSFAGIGHTRWATHGAPNAHNAHPHANPDVAVVHNGIIENHQELRKWLSSEGFIFRSETDTEVIPHLISYFLQQGYDADHALNRALSHLEGAFALGVLFKHDQEHLYAARRGSPLVLGSGMKGMSLGSDTMDLTGDPSHIMYLEEGDQARLGMDGIQLCDSSGRIIKRELQLFNADLEQQDKKDHRFFMHKEIHQQADAVRDTFYHTQRVLNDIPVDFKTLDRVTIIACGTSYYAAMVAKYWFEQIAGLAVDIDVASEFRYRSPILSKNGLTLFISQSGETADTLAALKYAKEQGQQTLSIVNVAESTIARETDYSLQTQAGPEIGVASTKAFTAQLTVLATLAVKAAVRRKHITIEQASNYTLTLSGMPALINMVLEQEPRFQQIGESLESNRDAYFIGRGSSYPIAMEGALKLKEISYIHAEGFGAGELKHGPIALIEKGTPVFVIAPNDNLLDKTRSNMEEVLARGGRCIFLGDYDSCKQLDDDALEQVALPQTHPLISPVIYTVALQLIAYHAALVKGTDVDQPRNLAKSVTVE